jgi:aspartyl-tRNA(Asn)/glutamyl-tRNA(Gln) amidotransferase subunit A
MCPAALGSQTGGSTLRPAAFNGIVGLKTEFGRISTYGVIPLSWTMDHVGILTRSVYDAAVVLQVIAGFDANDPRSLNAPVPNYLSGIGKQKAPHLGLAKDFFFDNANDEMKKEALSACKKLEKAGADIDEVKLPQDFKLAAEINRIIMGVEAAAYHEKMFAEKKSLYRPNIRSLIEQGLKTSSTDYSRAIQSRFERRAKITPILEKYDALVTPGAPGPAPGPETTGNAIMQRPWTTMGIPTIGIPVGLAKNGLPLGIQLVGEPYSEAKLIAVADWCEKALDVKLTPPIQP